MGGRRCRVDRLCGQCAIVAKVCPACEVARVCSDGENTQGLAFGKHKTCCPIFVFRSPFSDVAGALRETSTKFHAKNITVCVARSTVCHHLRELSSHMAHHKQCRHSALHVSFTLFAMRTAAASFVPSASVSITIRDALIAPSVLPFIFFRTWQFDCDSLSRYR